MLLEPLETRLLQDTIERTNWHVYPELSGHRDRPGLKRMLKLTVTALRANVLPPILFEMANYLAYLHGTATLCRA